MSDPIDDFLQFQKTSNLRNVIRGAYQGAKSFGRNVVPKDLNSITGSKLDAFQRGVTLGRSVQEGAAQAVGGTLLMGAGMAAKKVYDALGKRQDYNAMMQVNPDLKELKNEHGDRFNAAYSALHKLNPAFAGEPSIAGAHMRKFMANPETAGLMVASTVQLPKAPGQDPRVGSGFAVGFKAGPLHMQRML